MAYPCSTISIHLFWPRPRPLRIPSCVDHCCNSQYSTQYGSLFSSRQSDSALGRHFVGCRRSINCVFDWAISAFDTDVVQTRVINRRDGVTAGRGGTGMGSGLAMQHQSMRSANHIGTGSTGRGQHPSGRIGTSGRGQVLQCNTNGSVNGSVIEGRGDGSRDGRDGVRSCTATPIDANRKPNE